MKKIFFFLFFLQSFYISAQSLTPEEKKIVDLIGKKLPQNVKLLEDLVNINSGTLNTAGVKKLVNY